MKLLLAATAALFVSAAANAAEHPVASAVEPFKRPPVPKPMDVEEIGGPPGPEPITIRS